MSPCSGWVDRLRSTAGVTIAMDELAEAGVAQFYFKESMDTATARSGHAGDGGGLRPP